MWVDVLKTVHQPFYYKEGQDWIIDMVNNVLIEVLASIAEQERETIRKRQREGIDAAKKKESIWGDPL